MDALKRRTMTSHFHFVYLLTITELPSAPIVESVSGRFQGSWMKTRRGKSFQAYRGIRYAHPPVGELRFQPPKPILEYKELVNASDDGPACPLPAPPEYPVDEDCLTINIYTPTSNSLELLPVIFFIHPGGFYAMTGRSDLAGPHYLLDKDLVLVTINYRLGSLGFLSTGDQLAPGNNGFKDQVAALKWVQRNIRAFGGDPNLVTIAGCSAGSLSVMLHMISPMSKGLFQRGISMSASPMGPAPLPDNLYHLAQKQAQLVGCPTDNSSVIVQCLKTKPWRELGDSLYGFREWGFDPVRIWSPVVERALGQEQFLPERPENALRRRAAYTVPHLISQTTDEFFWSAYNVIRNESLLNDMNKNWERIAPISFQLPPENSSTIVAILKQKYLNNKPITADDKSARALGKIYGDSIVGFPTHRMANVMCRNSNHKVFYYEFAYIGNQSHYEDPDTGKPKGAAHHDDLIYLFTLSYRFSTIEVNDSNPDSRMVDLMTLMWYNFAKHGDPNGGADVEQALGVLPVWPAMTSDKRQYMRIDATPSVRAKMFEERFRLWEELYPMDYGSTNLTP
ncbi:unnamed protein product [Diatraea saccharalis]|uniref:Carboxylic ester hydrolase n=1 Tax=Diatraea saccharalis TaxID=40085 RepID=A0A9N9WHR9_9NEOP|nr:unnamed protein product [Diatraea saccharalis]